MRSRSTNLRAKVVALLASLVALWAFAAWVTVRDGINLIGVQTIDSRIVGPSEPLLLELQVERRLSTAELGQPSADRQEALAGSRSKVDSAAADFKSTAQTWLANLASSAEAERAVSDTITALDRLPATRQAIDNRGLGRAAAAQAYTDVIGSLFRLYDVVGSLDDKDIEADTRNLIEIYRIRDLMSQEDALLSGALAAGRITADEKVQFTELVVAQRFLTKRAAGQLRSPERTQFDQVLAGPAFTQLRALEDKILTSERATSKPPIQIQEWDASTKAALTELQEMVLDAGDAVVERAVPVAALVIVRLVLAAGLGLLAVIASVVVSVTTARALVAQLQRLRAAAHQLADERLPGVVERLGRGEKVDVAAEAPPLDFGSDEIGQVGQAFNRVQETAIRTAVDQAELRRSVRDVFLSLARRTQGLVHRQVTLLDAMERREHNADELEDLFRVDHLATRMRRNAENLIVLSGASPGRAWRRDIPMIDVARAATQEVEDYTRVTVMPFGSVGLTGRAAGDVIHLLAELIENALSFSPPNTEVEVRGQLVARGFVIEVEDRGLGMSEEELTDANQRIANPSEFNLSSANQLGLFVVSQLTQRHGLSVSLKTSPYGGTTAVVFIPMELVANAEALAAAAPQAARTHAADRSSGDGGPGVKERRGPIALAEPPPVRQPTTEQPTVDAPAPLRRAADAAAVLVDPHDGVATPAPPSQPSADRTPQGLPVRSRQASRARQLRAGADAAAETPAEVDTGRSPDEIRSLMARYQSGTRRGRDDARLLHDEDDAPAKPAAGDDR